MRTTTSMQLIVAEKPSVGRDIARVLGLRGGGRACIEGGERTITWCVGHLVELEEPAAYDARWKPWRLETLPMVPERFRLRPVQSTRDQLEAVRRMLRDGRFTEVVNACDAGREGELIFRYVYELSGSQLPIRRLWISSMTDEAIRAGFAALKPGGHYDPLADAARCRSEADWLVGLNATRAVTVRRRTGPDSTLYSIGRVQTPTLAIVVEREKAIRAFVPRDYWELRGKFRNAGGDTLTATWTRGKVTRFGQRALAEAVVARDRAHAAATDPEGPVIERVEQKRTREAPPLLFDLTSLQRTANRRFGLSASRTLEIAQALYETHKLLTYPRTDSRHLSSDLAGELPKVFRGVGQWPEYAELVKPLLEQPPPRSKRIFDDGKVHDHHAIIPTGKTARPGALGRDEQRVFDLVVRRFLGAFYPDAEFANTELVVRVGAAEVVGARGARGKKDEDRETLLEELPPPPDRYLARGRVRLVAGWQEVAGFGDDAGKESAGAGKESELEQSLPVVKEGDRLDGTFEAMARQTRPPPRHTEATLLSAMETAGRSIEEETLREAMKECGLGTPATRAATIETLLKRKFLAREGKQLVPTALGMGLLDALPVPDLASPELTGRWEERLSRIARGEEKRAAFMQDIVTYVREVVGAIRGGPRGAPPAVPRPTPPPPAAPAAREAAGPAEEPLSCPRCRAGTLITGKRGWGCSRWREGCGFVIWFETAGKRLSETQLRELVTKGKTRKARFTPAGEGSEAVAGRLVLDLAAAKGAARFVAE
jgi:DNA topoisomerase-3